MSHLRKIKTLITVVFLCAANASHAEYNVSAQTSFMHFFGQTKLSHFGGGLKMEYVYNDWVAFYGGGNYYSKKKYVGIVEAEAFDDNANPFLIDIEVPSSVYFIQTMIGTRFYFYGEINPAVKGGFGLYGIGEFSLLIGTSESQVPREDERYAFFNVPPENRGPVKGTFWNYTGSLGVGGEKQIGRPYIYAEAKFNVKINEANAFSVNTNIPYGLSYFVGLRIPLSNY